MTDMKRPVPPGYVEIFCKSYFHRGLGRRVFAWQYGLDAFRFVIPADKVRR